MQTIANMTVSTALPLVRSKAAPHPHPMRYGISAGSIVAAAYASGAAPEEIARAVCSMRFGDVSDAGAPAAWV
jgi:hypothetical protein